MIRRHKEEMKWREKKRRREEKGRNETKGEGVERKGRYLPIR